MSPFSRAIPLACLAVLLGFLTCAAAATQAQTVPGPQAARPEVVPGVPDLSKCPIDGFRDLLDMTPAERKETVAGYPEEKQRLILAKIREYETMRPDIRELRLRATQLGWYLSKLMPAPATNRAAQLQQIPPEDRELVATRLAEWDKLNPAAQRQLLENEATIRKFSEPPGPDEVAPSPARQLKLREGLARWQTIPPNERARLVARFQQFFNLTDQERQKVLRTLSAAERKQIEHALTTFSVLTPQQREVCINSFQKFASLTPDERQQFLKNAEKWKLMSPEERQSWRELVHNLLPPMPPGFDQTTPPLPPPMPPSFPPLPPQTSDVK